MATNVQSQARNATLTGAFGSNVTSGNVVLLCFNGVSTNGGAGVSITGVSGGTGTTWTKLLRHNPEQGSFDHSMEVWVGTGFSSAAMTITITVTGNNGTSYSWTAVEYNGLDVTQMSDVIYGVGLDLQVSLPRVTASIAGDAFDLVAGNGSNFTAVNLSEGSPTLETNAGTSSYHQRHYHKAVSQEDSIFIGLDQNGNGTWTYLGFTLGPATDRQRVATSRRFETTSTSMTVELPKNDGVVMTEADDVMVLYASGRDSTLTLDLTVSGWTRVAMVNQDDAAGDNDHGLAVFYKIAVGGDADPVLAINDGGGGTIAFTEIYRGFGGIGQSATGSSADSSTFTHTGLTTSGAETWVVSVVHAGDNNTLVLNTAQGFARLGYYQATNAIGQPKALGWALNCVETASASVTTPTWEQTTSGPDEWVGIIFELSGLEINIGDGSDDSLDFGAAVTAGGSVTSNYPITGGTGLDFGMALGSSGSVEASYTITGGADDGLDFGMAVGTGGVVGYYVDGDVGLDFGMDVNRLGLVQNATVGNNTTINRLDPEVAIRGRYDVEGLYRKVNRPVLPKTLYINEDDTVSEIRSPSMDLDPDRLFLGGSIYELRSDDPRYEALVDAGYDFEVVG